MKRKINFAKLTSLLLALLILSGSIPAFAGDCEKGHTFVANSASTETEHDGYCSVCGKSLVGEHTIGLVDNGDGTHSTGCTVCHYVASGASKEAHSVASSKTTDPTCTKDGSRTVVCSCGATSKQTIPATGHDVGEGVVTREATCTSDGEISYTCRNCGETRTKSIPATGHDVGEGVVTREATCTVDGEISYTCRNCGETRTQPIPAIGHNPDEGVVTREATCAAEGEITYTCLNCGETRTKSIPTTDHSWNGGEVTQEPTTEAEGVLTYTCTVCGETRTQPIERLPKDTKSEGNGSEALPPDNNSEDNGNEVLPQDNNSGANGNNGNEVLPQDNSSEDNGSEALPPDNSSEGDGSEALPPDNNSEDNGSEALPPDNNSEGDDYSTFGTNDVCTHNWGAWTQVDASTHQRACTLCPEVETAAHKLNGVVTTQPTTTDPGVMTYTCADCGYSYTEEIPVGTCVHQWGDWEKVDNTTHQRACTLCPEVETAAHNLNGVVTTQPTTTTPGVMTYTCADCGYSYTEEIPPVACVHQWGAWEKVDDTTHQRTCTLCLEVETAAHNWSDWTFDNANHAHVCLDCGAQVSAAHNMDAGATTVEPTETKPGTKLFTCTDDCGYFYTEVIPPTGTPECETHDWGDWSTDDPAKHVRTCKVCGAQQSAAHTYGTWALDPSNTNQHVKACTVCGRTVAEAHTWNNGTMVTEPTPYTTGLKEYHCIALGCSAAKYDNLPKTQPELNKKHLYFPVRVTCDSKSSHTKNTFELAVATKKFSDIYMGADNYYHVSYSMTFNQSWQDYFLDLAGWSGSHKLTKPSNGKYTLTAYLNEKNEWVADTVKLVFEDTAERYTIRFKSGESIIDTYVINAGDEIGALPEIDDFDFLGWYYKNGTKVSEYDEPTSNLTVYARYTYDVPKTGNNDHQLMLILLGVSGAMLLVMVFASVQMLRLSKKSKR